MQQELNETDTKQKFAGKLIIAKRYQELPQIFHTYRKAGMEKYVFSIMT